MCLVLKFYNGKVVSIANEQNHRQNHRAIQCRISILILQLNAHLDLGSINYYVNSLKFPQKMPPLTMNRNNLIVQLLIPKDEKDRRKREA